MAHRADINRRAPIVIAMDSVFCEGSPQGRYIAFYTINNRQASFLDTQTHTIHEVQLPSNVLSARALWLPNERYLYYTTWEEYRTPDPYYDAPSNGWIVDISDQTIVDITTLSQTLKQQILHDADQVSQPRSTSPVFTSPNGQYHFYAYGEATISLANGQVLNGVRTFRSFHQCFQGWRSDSSGYYLIDGQFLAERRGSIRLLLTNPPPPYLPIAWLILGFLGSTTIWRAQQLYALIMKRVSR
jgi:hypothetical protein